MNVSTHIPRWIGVAVTFACAAYVILYVALYFAPHLSLDWLMLFALGELVFMGWMLISGWRLEEATGVALIVQRRNSGIGLVSEGPELSAR